MKVQVIHVYRVIIAILVVIVLVLHTQSMVEALRWTRLVVNGTVCCFTVIVVITLMVDVCSKLMPKFLDILLALAGALLYMLVAYIAIKYYVDSDTCPELKDKMSLAKGIIALLTGIIYINMIIVLLFFGPEKHDGDLFGYRRGSYRVRARDSL